MLGIRDCDRGPQKSLAMSKTRQSNGGGGNLGLAASTRPPPGQQSYSEAHVLGMCLVACAALYATCLVTVMSFSWLALGGC